MVDRLPAVESVACLDPRPTMGHLEYPGACDLEMITFDEFSDLCLIGFCGYSVGAFEEGRKVLRRKVPERATVVVERCGLVTCDNTYTAVGWGLVSIAVYLVIARQWVGTMVGWRVDKWSRDADR